MKKRKKKINLIPLDRTREPPRQDPPPLTAEGLEHSLYQCSACGAEFHMASRGAELFCAACGARWRMTGLGRLEGVGDTPSYFPHIPDWYEWERRQVEEAIAWGAYEADFRVRVQALPNAASFVELGEGRLHHGPEGFTLTVRELKVSAGAGFVVALTGDIMTMPGLPKVPAAEKIDVDKTGKITGLF